jgi:hypothetical protein
VGGLADGRAGPRSGVGSRRLPSPLTSHGATRLWRLRSCTFVSEVIGKRVPPAGQEQTLANGCFKALKRRDNVPNTSSHPGIYATGHIGHDRGSEVGCFLARPDLRSKCRRPLRRTQEPPSVHAVSLQSDG